MTPIDFARIMARADDPEDRALAVAIITRGLTDDDHVHWRQGWPMDESTVTAAARYLGLAPDPELVSRALALAPTLSDAMLNKAAVR